MIPVIPHIANECLEKLNFGGKLYGQKLRKNI